jgi:ribosome-associated translation inhibitor RaiA
MQTATILKVDRSALVEVRELPEAIEDNILEQIARLRQEYPQAIDCKVSVKTPAFCKEGCYQIEIAIGLSGRTLTIDRSPNLDCYQEDLYVAIWSAFNLAKKQLKQELTKASTADAALGEASLHRRNYPLRRTIGYAGA